MKKYYLSVDQRKRIINAVLSDAAKLEKEKEKQGGALTGVSLDIVDGAIQELQQIATLLKVEEHEL